MAKDFTQALYVKPDLHTSCRKCVTKCVKIYGFYVIDLQDALEIVLHGARFHRFDVAPSQNVALPCREKLLDHHHNARRDGNQTIRADAFRRGDHNCCFLFAIHLNPLHCLVNMERPFP